MVTAGEREVFRHRLEGIVEEMGVTLQRTAYSTNIKIRRDHTCALFDADLRHVAQHDIAPQHIGSLVSVVPRNLRDRLDDLEPGDGFLVNDPYRGAVHLPDVMLLSPLFVDGDLVGVAANSAHHVDIGGATPGGIPTDSTDLYAEGTVIPCVHAVEDWEYDEAVLSLLARNARGERQRRGDYRAQLGANRIGQRRYAELLAEYGPEAAAERIDDLLAYTERRARAAIVDLPDGEYRAEDEMDGDGVSDESVTLALTIRIDGDRVEIDFTGTAQRNEGPLNCTPAMAFAGTMAVLMALIGGDVPKNDGFYRAFDLIAPEGTMVNPRPQAPVAAGWEIAMRAGDLVTKALAEALPAETIAATKGVVCNLAYGGDDPRADGESYVHYETVAGGYGARESKDGMEAVQAHFQNTANSPIEELESELPVRVRRYELVPDSAGAGRRRGGLGVRRDIEFYGDRATASILSERATARPWGLFGGNSASPARYVLNPETDSEDLPSKCTVDVDPGEVVSVRTPGGGGYGDPLERDPERVLADVVAGKVSAAAAREEYGVVVEDGASDGHTVDEGGANGDTLRIDRAATDRLRDSRREER